MTEKQPKKTPEWFSSALENALVRLVLVAVTALLAGGGATGVVMAGGDTARIDSLKVRVDSLETNVGQMQANQLEMFSAQIEADSTLKAVLESRAANRRKAAESRASTQKMFNDITGGTP